MVLEHVVLPVIPGREEEFERVFADASAIIGSATGFRSLRLGRCLETPGRYVLLVEWDSLDDHMVGFRGSPDYERWRALLHHFYDPFPTVEHYETIRQFG
jgi:heme-degrading monooxygenase HmoA